MTESETLGRFIRQSRLDRGMSLGQLASKVGRSSSSVRRWERDEVAPALAVVPVLADALGVDVDELEHRRPGVDQSAGPVVEEKLTHTTMEQPLVRAVAPENPDRPSTSRLGLFGDMWASISADKASWIGWARGIATAIALIVMLIIFLWAVGELFDALRDVWNSLDTN
jgi:transcriptional regulator with XRE-family HTH domain